jgi:truncated hemoglobin YjbI
VPSEYPIDDRVSNVAETETSIPAEERDTLYGQLGGAPVITEAVDRFYRLVLADPELAPYFVGADVAVVKRHQVLLLSSVLGGPQSYGGRGLDEAHAGLGVTGPHYDKVAALLLDVLAELGAPAHIAEAVASTLDAVREQIVEPPLPAGEGAR